MPNPSRFSGFRRRLQLKACYARSFLKRDWQLSDYPVTVREFGPARPDPGPGWHFPRFEAYIQGWHLSGTGDTPDEARSSLTAAFQRAKARHAERGEPLPRPGRIVPFDLASTVRIDAHGSLAQDFISRVLGLEWAWVSDLSGLGEFAIGSSVDVYLSRIHEIYGVDCSGLADAPLVDILDRIAAKENKKGSPSFE
ncbi:MAG TPA: hypothetical protein VMD25_13345 [Acidobacteriaceae bacterium]|nr:hypothetical protein [Acidobacteriaceae bacterium]